MSEIETWEVTKEKVAKIFEDNLGLEVIVLELEIDIKLLNYKDKTNIM